MAGLDGAQDRRRQRRDGRRQPEAEHQDAGQDLGQIVGARVGADEQQQAHAGDDRPAGHEHVRADPIRQRSESAREQEHHDRHRQQRQPGLDRGVAADLLDEQDQEERRDAESRVQRQRRQVADCEVADLEQAERHHRLRVVALPEQERDEQNDPSDQRDEHARIAPPVLRLLDQREHRVRRGRARTGSLRPRRRDRASGGRARAGSSSNSVIATGTRLIAKIHRHDANWIRAPPPSGPITVATPVHAVHVPIAAARSSSPNVSMISASVLGTSSAPAIPWAPAGEDQELGARRHRAQQRADPEADQPDREDPPAPVQVAERSADQQQRAERQQIRLDHPLLISERAAQVRADRRQRDVDDRAVEEHDARAEDARDQRRPLDVCPGGVGERESPDAHSAPAANTAFDS